MATKLPQSRRTPGGLSDEERQVALRVQKEHWRKALDRAMEQYEAAKAAGTLLPAGEIDRALDEIRGRGE